MWKRIPEPSLLVLGGSIGLLTYPRLGPCRCRNRRPRADAWDRGAGDPALFLASSLVVGILAPGGSDALWRWCSSPSSSSSMTETRSGHWTALRFRSVFFKPEMSPMLEIIKDAHSRQAGTLYSFKVVAKSHARVFIRLDGTGDPGKGRSCWPCPLKTGMKKSEN